MDRVGSLTFSIYISTSILFIHFCFPAIHSWATFTSGPIEYLHAYIFYNMRNEWVCKSQKLSQHQQRRALSPWQPERSCCSVLIKDPPVFVVGAACASRLFKWSWFQQHAFRGWAESTSTLPRLITDMYVYAHPPLEQGQWRADADCDFLHFCFPSELKMFCRAHTKYQYGRIFQFAILLFSPDQCNFLIFHFLHWEI
jgi:hypothetical protein